MVASVTNISLQNGNVDSTTADSLTNGAASFKTLPKGKYTLVGIDIDTTGRRLIDEIVQLAAYTPKDHFEQYIMPYMNLNPAARQRHQVRVISIGFYRMLKSMQTYKIIKSKSEVAALRDFLDWLEALKAKDANSQGCILVYHEERKFIPYMILESLKKYNLLDRFLITVKSFANGLNLAKENPNGAFQHYSLRKLMKVLTTKSIDSANNNKNNNQNGAVIMQEGFAPAEGNSPNKMQHKPLPPQQEQPFDGNASVRAKLAYDVALHLSNHDQKVEALDSAGALERFVCAIQSYAKPIHCDIDELHSQNENLERQNSFRPVFLNYFKTTLYHRVRAVKFRIILAEQGYDLPMFNAIWAEKQKAGIIETLQVIDELKPDDKTELTDLLDSYFDPNKTTIKPVIKNNNRRRNRRGAPRTNNAKADAINNNTNMINNNNVVSSSSGPGTEQGAGGDKQVAGATAGAAPVQHQQQMPDSTTKSSSPPSAVNKSNGGAKSQRLNGRRNRSRTSSMKNDSSLPAPGGGPAHNSGTTRGQLKHPNMPVSVGGPAKPM